MPENRIDPHVGFNPTKPLVYEKEYGPLALEAI